MISSSYFKHRDLQDAVKALAEERFKSIKRLKEMTEEDVKSLGQTRYDITRAQKVADRAQD